MKREMNKKLAKMKMPERKDEKIDLMDLSAPEEGSPEEEAQESPEEEQQEMDMGEEAPEKMKQPSQDLEQASDEDLLAEIRKRGLMKELQGHMAPAHQDEMA